MDIGKILREKYSAEQLQMWGVKTIVIVDARLMSMVDYCGAAYKSTGTIRLFSGHITEGATFEHELAHMKTFWLMKKRPSLKAEWTKIAGPYNKVKYKVGSRQRGSTATVEHYMDKNKTRPSVPKFGYVRGYGGNEWQEDVATFVEAIRGGHGSNFDKIIAITNKYLKIYIQKIKLLDKYGFIRPEEAQAPINLLSAKLLQMSLLDNP
jgi:hypothetical protein